MDIVFNSDYDDIIYDFKTGLNVRINILFPVQFELFTQTIKFKFQIRIITINIYHLCTIYLMSYIYLLDYTITKLVS